MKDNSDLLDTEHRMWSDGTVDNCEMPRLAHPQVCYGWRLITVEGNKNNHSMGNFKVFIKWEDVECIFFLNLWWFECCTALLMACAVPPTPHPINMLLYSVTSYLIYLFFCFCNLLLFYSWTSHFSASQHFLSNCSTVTGHCCSFIHLINIFFYKCCTIMRDVAWSSACGLDFSTWFPLKHWDFSQFWVTPNGWNMKKFYIFLVLWLRGVDAPPLLIRGMLLKT